MSHRCAVSDVESFAGRLAASVGEIVRCLHALIVEVVPKESALRTDSATATYSTAAGQPICWVDTGSRYCELTVHGDTTWRFQAPSELHTLRKELKRAVRQASERHVRIVSLLDQLRTFRRLGDLYRAQDCFRAILEAVYGDVQNLVRAARRKFPNLSGTQSLAHDVVVRVLERNELPKIENHKHLMALLWKVAKRASVDSYRRQPRVQLNESFARICEPRTTPGPEGPDWEGALAYVRRHHADAARALELRLKGNEPAEIASALEISVRTVRNRMTVAMVFVRSFFESEGE